MSLRPDAGQGSYEDIKHILTEAGGRVRGTQVWCPWHEDKSPSGSLYQKDGVWRYQCHTDACGVRGDLFDLKALMDGRSVGAVWSDYQHETPQPERTYTRAELKRIYKTWWVYQRNGKPILFIGRTDPPDGKKYFSQYRSTDPEAQVWVKGAPEKPWPLYRAPFTHPRVIVVEGEKAADALRAIGYEATTSPGGAQNASHADWSPLAGKDVVIWPDNDKPGLGYAETVGGILHHLDPKPSVSIVDVSALPAKADAADCDPDQIHSILAKRSSVRPSNLLAVRIQGLAEGSWGPVPLPFTLLGRMSKPLLPGSVTLLSGSPGSSKSLFVLQCAAWWFKHEISCAVYELEEDATFHLHRALAQRMEDSQVMDHYTLEHASTEYLTRLQWHSDFIDGFAGSIHDSPRDSPTLRDIGDWIFERAEEGIRVVVVDPITFALPGNEKVWQADHQFMSRLKTRLRDYNTAVLLVTHPSKFSDQNSIDAIAGGASYTRLSQTIFSLRAFEPKKGKFLRAYDDLHQTANIEAEYNREIIITKSRSGMGQGLRIGYLFNKDTLCFEEAGLRVQGG